ncbi:MAG: hypothetical protein ABSB41_18545 [Anaerolineales bacterium]
MKRMMYLSMLSILILAVLLTACSQSSSSTSGSSSQSLSEADQLLVGTFKLETTKSAVDAKEAASLLPLWQAYNQLTTSDTTAQAEMMAVVSQIQSTMSAAQIQAIKSMNLNQKDLSEAINSLGVVNSEVSTTSEGSTSTTSLASTTGGGVMTTAVDSQGAGAGPAATGDPVSADIQGTGTTLNNTTSTSTQQATTVSTNENIASLLNAVIDLLQKRAGTLAG